MRSQRFSSTPLLCGKAPLEKIKTDETLRDTYSLWVSRARTSIGPELLNDVHHCELE
jgi:hypothetical protein